MNAAAAGHIADIYAHSLMDLAGQSRAVEDVESDLDVLAAVLARQPALLEFLASPYFAEPAKCDLVRKVLSGRTHPLTLNLLCVMIDHNRGALVSEVIDRYRHLFRMRQGYQTVTVTVAQTMSEPQRDKLRQDLTEAMKTKIDMDVHVDPSIVGGVIIRAGDRMVDNSMRGRLNRVVHRLTGALRRKQQDFPKRESP
jgi:F-type H+-transporting ATPase subunit delta